MYLFWSGYFSGVALKAETPSTSLGVFAEVGILVRWQHVRRGAMAPTESCPDMGYAKLR